MYLACWGHAHRRSNRRPVRVRGTGGGLRRTGLRRRAVAADRGGRRGELTYGELDREVARVAAGLAGAGVRTGDRVGGYLPNVPEALIAMLAAASLGAVWSSCSPDFGATSVIDRFAQITPKVLVAS